MNSGVFLTRPEELVHQSGSRMTQPNGTSNMDGVSDTIVAGEDLRARKKRLARANELVHRKSCWYQRLPSTILWDRGTPARCCYTWLQGCNIHHARMVT